MLFRSSTTIKKITHIHQNKSQSHYLCLKPFTTINPQSTTTIKPKNATQSQEIYHHHKPTQPNHCNPQPTTPPKVQNQCCKPPLPHLHQTTPAHPPKSPPPHQHCHLRHRQIQKKLSYFLFYNPSPSLNPTTPPKLLNHCPKPRLERKT